MRAAPLRAVASCCRRVLASVPTQLATNACTVERQALQDWHKKGAMGGDFARAVAQQMEDFKAAAEEDEKRKATLL